MLSEDKNKTTTSLRDSYRGKQHQSNCIGNNRIAIRSSGIDIKMPSHRVAQHLSNKGVGSKLYWNPGNEFQRTTMAKIIHIIIKNESFLKQ